MTPPSQGAAGQGRLSESALERRVKRWWRSGPYETYVQVTPGLERLAAEELRALGLVPEGGELEPDRGGVGLELDPAEVMRANLSLRIASRVLLRLGTFPASSPEMLYDRARRLPWEVHLGFATSYALRVTSRNSKLQAGDEVANTVASAVARHMRELGLYPKPAEEAPLEFHVRLLNDHCTISLDTSGELLHRRGFRKHVHAAPVRETLAAAMVQAGLAGMDEPPGTIVDPFCGSGTLLMEAAEMLQGLQPGRDREFAFERAAWHRPGRWREAQREAERRAPAAAAHLWPGAATDRRPPRLLGFDHDPKALDAARRNLAAPPYEDAVVAEADSTLLDFDALGVERGLVLTNLPYGVRLRDGLTPAATTERFLTQLLTSHARWRVVLLATPAEAEIAARLLTVEEMTSTRNGGLDVRMVVASSS